MRNLRHRLSRAENIASFGLCPLFLSLYPAKIHVMFRSSPIAWISRMSSENDDEHDVPGYQRPEPARPLRAAKREFLFSFSQLTPLTREPSQGSHALPACAGRGRRLGMGPQPRVPLALHPGLLIFRP